MENILYKSWPEITWECSEPPSTTTKISAVSQNSLDQDIYDYEIKSGSCSGQTMFGSTEVASFTVCTECGKNDWLTWGIPVIVAGFGAFIAVFWIFCAKTKAGAAKAKKKRDYAQAEIDWQVDQEEQGFHAKVSNINPLFERAEKAKQKQEMGRNPLSGGVAPAPPVMQPRFTANRISINQVPRTNAQQIGQAIEQATNGVGRARMHRATVVD